MQRSMQVALFSLFLMAGALFLPSSVARADTFTPYCGTTTVVYLAEHINYKGALLSFSPGNNVANLSVYEMNDRISSICVPKGQTVTIYEHANYGGASKTYTNIGVNFNGWDWWWNDKISSLKVK